MQIARYRAFWVLGAITILGGHEAAAQTGVIAPPSSPIERIQPAPQPSVAPPRVEQQEAPPVEAGPPVHVTTVEIEGATVYPAEELKAFLAGIEGATVPRGQIVEAVRAIQAKYRNDGYFLTVVRGGLDPVPDGVRLRVRVTEGYISDVKIDGDVGPVAVLIYNYLHHLTELRPTRLADVERYALLAQNIPGITLRTVLRPAKDEPGAVELVAQVERKAIDGLITDDNRGPRTAGPNEALFGIGANSFTSAGERTEVLIYDTPFNNEQVFGQASVEGFVGSEGLKLRAYVGDGVSYPGDVLALTGFRSYLKLAGVSASYPAIRTRAMSLYLNAALDFSDTQIDLLGSDDEHQATSIDDLRILRLGESYEIQDDIFGTGRAAANTANFTYHRGIPELGGTSNDDPLPARPGERNDFNKITGELIRVQDLYAWSTYSLALKTAFAGQWTNDILPPSEKFFLGGNQYGRGFFNGEVTGDRVAAGTVELQLNDKLQGSVFGQQYDMGLQYYGFYDIGQTFETATGDINQHIESTGIGVRATVTPQLSVQVEGVDRFTRRPTEEIGSREKGQALYFRIVTRF